MSGPISADLQGAAAAQYLTLMERAVSPYRWRDLVERRAPGGGRLDLHAYSRIACVLAGLIAAGCLETSRLEEVCAMVGACCDELAGPGAVTHADFAVKETLLAIELLEPVAPVEQVAHWDALLARIDPETTYAEVLRPGRDPATLHNINVYMMVGEFLRERRGLTSTEDLFERHWPEQLRRFDSDGRYRDPGCPMLYDLATRVQVQHLLHSGYRGRYAEDLDAHLRTAGLVSLRMQSASGEIPFGGRSNQFLFNEVLHAASCEYEAHRWATEGDHRRAGAFRASARLAVDAIARWLAPDPPRSIKNLFPPHSRHGAESYGYYEKYMTSVGSFAALALLFADGTDGADGEPPALVGGYVHATSDDFHQVVASAGGYSVQIDTRADHRYDATGLGRLHRRGVPTELALSVPLTGGEGYELVPGCQRLPAAIGPAWRTDDGTTRRLAASAPPRVDLDMHRHEVDGVRFTVRYRGEEVGDLAQVYELDGSGLTITTQWARFPVALRQWWFEVPVLRTAGADEAVLRTGAHDLDVELDGYRYHLVGEAEPSVGAERLGNRNGIYRLVQFPAQGRRARVRLSLHLPA